MEETGSHLHEFTKQFPDLPDDKRELLYPETWNPLLVAAVEIQDMVALSSTMTPVELAEFIESLAAIQAGRMNADSIPFITEVQEHIHTFTGFTRQKGIWNQNPIMTTGVLEKHGEKRKGVINDRLTAYLQSPGVTFNVVLGVLPDGRKVPIGACIFTPHDILPDTDPNYWYLEFDDRSTPLEDIMREHPQSVIMYADRTFVHANIRTLQGDQIQHIGSQLRHATTMQIVNTNKKNGTLIYTITAAVNPAMERIWKRERYTVGYGEIVFPNLPLATPEFKEAGRVSKRGIIGYRYYASGTTLRSLRK